MLGCLACVLLASHPALSSRNVGLLISCRAVAQLFPIRRYICLTRKSLMLPLSHPTTLQLLHTKLASFAFVGSLAAHLSSSARRSQD